MTFKLGDKVFVLDQDIEGVVTAVIGDTLEVETTFGF